ncbi:MAG: ABC transporter ATP-binding protein [Candidatus Dormibacteraceae bacterium]
MTEVTPASSSSATRSSESQTKLPARRIPRLVFGSLRLIWEAAPRDFIVMSALQVLSGVAIVVSFLIIRNAVAVIINTAGNHDLTLVLPALGLLVGVNLVMTFMTGLQTQQQQVIGELVGQLATDRILGTASTADLAAFDMPSFYDRLQRASAGAGFRPWQMTQAVLASVHSLVAVVALLIALYLLEPLLVPMVVPVFVPLWLASTLSGRSMYRFLYDMTATDRRRAYIRKLLIERETAKEVRVFGLASYFRLLHAQLSHERISGLRRVARNRTVVLLGGSASTSLLIALMLGTLLYLVAMGRMHLPAASAAALAIFQLGNSASSLVASAGQVFENAMYIEDYLSFLNVDAAPEAPRAKPPVGFDVLRVSHVDFRYPASGASTLIDVSLEIQRGEIVALVGENGSGKTTLAKLLCGLYRPDAGHILWDGVEMSAIGSSLASDSISIVFQDFVRYMFSAADNIGIGRVESMEDRVAVVAAASKAEADGFVERLPMGYDTQLGRLFDGGEELSEGQWQRIALARAFFRNAPFVVLDEPTADLDARAEHALFASFRSLFKGRTVLLISHRLSSVRSADRIYVLKQGRIVEHGTHADLMQREGLYGELYRLQASVYAGSATNSGAELFLKENET